MKYLGFFDGSAKPNPGEMVIGGVIKDPISEEVIHQYSVSIGYGTNNEAEYRSLLKLLARASKNGIKKIHIKGDSLLIINQVNGVYKAKNPRMKKLKEVALILLDDFDEWTLEHIPREQNEEADKLT